MPVKELNLADQYVVASADTDLLELYDALPHNLFPPFPPVELPGGLGGLLERGGFGQQFFFASEILGLTYRTPNGRRVKAGGRVVKNVQGYDLVRLFVGSFGLLGVAEEAVIRLRPGRDSLLWRPPGDNLEQLGAGGVRFAWLASGLLHAFHFGHPRELKHLTQTLPGEPLSGHIDYQGLFPNGMGVGEGNALVDARFTWADGTGYPQPPELFRRLAGRL